MVEHLADFRPLVRLAELVVGDEPVAFVEPRLGLLAEPLAAVARRVGVALGGRRRCEIVMPYAADVLVARRRLVELVPEQVRQRLDRQTVDVAREQAGEERRDGADLAVRNDSVRSVATY